MELIAKRILIVLGIFNSISIISSQRSPCPETFEFKVDRTLYGLIRLRTQGVVQNLYLTVNFTIATEVSSSYPGKLEYLGENREGIMYRLNFPVINPVPKITSIVANGNEVCSAPPDLPAPGVYISEISLNHQRGFSIQQGVQSTSMGSDRFPNIGFPASPTFSTSGSDGQGLDIDSIVNDFINDKDFAVKPSWSADTATTGYNNYQPTRFQNRPSWTNINNVFSSNSETKKPLRPTFSSTPIRNAGFVNQFGSNTYEHRETFGQIYPSWSSESDIQDRYTPVQNIRPQERPQEARPVVRPTQPPPRPVRPVRPVTQPRPRPTTTTTDPPVFIQEEYTPETERPTPRPAATRAPATPNRGGSGDTTNRIECGRPVGDGVATLIVKGDSYERGEWPWLVAIYERKGSALDYICSGSLLSELHIVTAAHCVRQRGSEIAKENILLRIGVFKLEDWGHEQTRSLAAAHVHEEYSPSTLANDIVLFTLNLAVQFDDYIRPVCLWHGDPSLSKVIKQIGVVAGWGRSEFGPAGKGEPRAVRIPIVSTEQCRASRQDFHSLTNNRTMCAGEGQGGSGKGPCVGDSGGGFYLRTEGRWRLRGIVSLSLKPDNGENTCNLQEYVVFTDAAQYLPWLYNHVYRT